MEIETNLANEILQTIRDSKKIMIFSHRNPDADTVGCNLTLRLLAEKMGIQAESACIDSIPENYKKFAGYRSYKQDIDPEEYDLFVAVDCGSKDQIHFPGKYPEILKKKFINIDHHPSNDHLGSINLVDDHAASTSIVIYKLIKIWGMHITPQIATWLLFGIYFDTGSFMHSNTTDEVYAISSDLLARGADLGLITETLFKNLTFEKLCLWGKALDGMKQNKNGTIVAGVTPEDYISCHAKKEDLSGLIDYLGSIKDAKFAALLSNDPETHQVRGSLRTRKDDVDVREIAKRLGGGGHTKASGFSVNGRLKKEMHWTITPE